MRRNLATHFLVWLSASPLIAKEKELDRLFEEIVGLSPDEAQKATPRPQDVEAVERLQEELSEELRKIKPDPLNPQVINGGFERDENGDGRPDNWHYFRQATLVDDGARPGIN